jgi:hypothetical protein
MRIVQTLANEHPITTLGTALRTMQGVMTDKAAVGREEKISVGTSQSGQSVKCYTIYGHKDRSGETGLWEELDPVRIVVIGHDELFYSPPSPSPLFI